MSLDTGILILLSLSILINLALILVANKLYKNTKLVDSPDNIVENLNHLSKVIQVFEKSLVSSNSKNNKIAESNFGQLNKNIDRNSQQNLKIANTLQENLLQILRKNLTEIKESTEDSKSQLTSLREYASTQDEEIKRHREGYDFSIIKKIAVPIISVIDKIEERIMTADEKDPFIQEVIERLLVVLESHDIEKFEIKKNVSHKIIEKIDSFSQLQANVVADKELHGLVHSVILQPYVYNHNNGKRPFRNGVISINKYIEA